MITFFDSGDMLRSHTIGLMQLRYRHLVAYPWTVRDLMVTLTEKQSKLTLLSF